MLDKLEAYWSTTPNLVATRSNHIMLFLEGIHVNVLSSDASIFCRTTCIDANFSTNFQAWNQRRNEKKMKITGGVQETTADVNDARMIKTYS